jgi:hypothetical protein
VTTGGSASDIVNSRSNCKYVLDVTEYGVRIFKADFLFDATTSLDTYEMKRPPP